MAIYVRDRSVSSAPWHEMLFSNFATFRARCRTIVPKRCADVTESERETTDTFCEACEEAMPVTIDAAERAR